MLTKWADYLVANGLDPENQLCSADMFGHLPHCANLALKAIIGIGGYAQLCEMTGRPEEAKKYLAIARDYAAKWQEMAQDDGRTRLAYHLPGTWGMKHNLIWDRVLGLDLFPESVGDAEIAWYLKVQNKYGLPVDNRTDTSLIDWAMWSIAPARKPEDFAGPGRTPVPLRERNAHARAAVGLVRDDRRHARRVFRRARSWAASSSGCWPSRRRGQVSPRRLRRNGRLGAFPEFQPRQLQTDRADRAAAAGHVALHAREAGGRLDQAGLRRLGVETGSGGIRHARARPAPSCGHAWQTQDIWLRREFTLPDVPLKNPVLFMHYDESPEVYLNGVLAAQLDGYVTEYGEVTIEPAALRDAQTGPQRAGGPLPPDLRRAVHRRRPGRRVKPLSNCRTQSYST